MTILVENSNKHSLKMVQNTGRMRSSISTIFLLFYKKYNIFNESITIETIYECLCFFLYLSKDNRISGMEKNRD